MAPQQCCFSTMYQKTTLFLQNNIFYNTLLWMQKLDLILSSCQEKISILLPNIYCIFFSKLCILLYQYFIFSLRKTTLRYVSGFTQSSNILLRHTCLLYQSKTLEFIFCLLFIDVVCFMRGDLIEP